jgi:lipid-binding SYLF domain-containing protein
MKSLAALIASVSMSMFALESSMAQDVEDFSPTIQMFQDISGVNPYFESAYGYAVWRTIARGGLGIGAATGRGQVYVNETVVGFSRLIDVSIGLQAGGQAYQQIIFFENREAFDAFSEGSFEFDAQASAVAVTASAQANAGTQSSQASAGAGSPSVAAAPSGYEKGLRVFTMATGGLMYQATIAGQKYGFRGLNDI